MAAYDLKTLLEGSELGGMGKAVAAAVAKHREAAQERLSDQLVAVIDEADRTVHGIVLDVRNARQREKLARKRLAEVARTVEFLRATGNPLPYYKQVGTTYMGEDFCGTVGVACPPLDDDLWSVPEDFQASESSDDDDG